MEEVGVLLRYDSLGSAFVSKHIDPNATFRASESVVVIAVTAER
jgi:hypothetical protein